MAAVATEVSESVIKLSAAMNQLKDADATSGAKKVTAINTSILLPVYSLDSKLILISKVFSNWNPPPPKSDKLFLTQKSFIFYG